MAAYWKAVCVLGVLLVVANAAYIHRVPGLMGDEASEGENVYELRQREGVTIQGERSYIGPGIDYVRVPFISIFGYTPLALRLVTLFFSLGTFLLAAVVLQRLFGAGPALFGLVFLCFSPIYLSQQRISWAITLMPFFAFLLLYFLTSRWRYRTWLAGLAAGAGLANHILFLPTLMGVVGGAMLYALSPASSAGSSSRFSSRLRGVLTYWSGLVGFAAGFGLQFYVLLTQRDDQGDIEASTELFTQRIADLPDVLPLVVSGSAYAARYTGVEFAPWVIGVITLVLAFLIACALVLPHFAKASRGLRFASSLWALGIVIQIVILMYMVDRYSLRYFVAPVLGMWTLAGVGLGSLASSLPKFWRPTRAPGRPEFGRLRSLILVAVAIVLTIWTVMIVLIPFLRTGGSTSDFLLGNRTDSAAALVDTRPLLACLRGAGAVTSENVHIFNRLQFMSHQYPDLRVLAQEEAAQVQWLVEYRDENSHAPGTLCPELRHFRVVANQANS